MTDDINDKLFPTDFTNLKFTHFVPFVGAPRMPAAPTPVVAMVRFENNLYVATQTGVYVKINNELVPMSFVVLPPGDGIHGTDEICGELSEGV